jgi:glycosyltransferase involved in cell wall biosynthesis
MVLGICAPCSLQYFKFKGFIKGPALGSRAVPSIEAQITYLTNKPQLEVHVITLDQNLRQPQEINYRNVTFHLIPAPRRFKLSTLYYFVARNLADYLRKIKPEVIEAHWTYEYALGALMSGLPTVVRVHDWMDNEFKIVKRMGFLVKSLIQKYVLRQSKFVIGDTPYIASLARPYLKGNIYEVPNMVFPEFYQIGTQEIKSNILYLGGISQRKNILILLEAVGNLVRRKSNFQLIVAGPASSSSWSYRKRVVSLMRELEERGIAKNGGMLDYQRMFREMADCAFLVHPSREESFGMTVAEAQAAGRPVVAGRSGGAEYLIMDGETGFLVDPDDLEGFIGKMEFLLDNDEARRRMGQAARCRMQSLLDPDKIFAATAEIYRLAMEN